MKMFAPTSVLSLLLASAVAAPVFAQDAPSEETINYFARNCASCHTIGGGRLTGPDLKGLTQRKDAEWVTKFLMDPKGTIDSGGEYEQRLLAESRGVYMPTPVGMNTGLAAKLITLIEQEEQKEKSLFAGVQVSDRPLTAADVQKGRELFLGATDFESGAPACVSCHTSASIGGFGGGNLGPDLTAVYARLEGRTALAAWLSSPPSETMQPLFANRPIDSDEVLALVAFFGDEAASGLDESESSNLPFLLMGLGLAATLLVILDLVWRNRFRGVRRSLVHEARNA